MKWQETVVAGLEGLRDALDSSGAQMRRNGPVTRNRSARGGLRFDFCPAGESTFEIVCALDESEAQVNFDGWHEQFTSHDRPEDVVKLVAWGLSDRCKLKVKLAGGRPYRWQLWSKGEAEWRQYSEVGLLLFNWFARRSEREMQNDVLDWNEQLWNEHR